MSLEGTISSQQPGAGVQKNSPFPHSPLWDAGCSQAVSELWPQAPCLKRPGCVGRSRNSFPTLSFFYSWERVRAGKERAYSEFQLYASCFLDVASCVCVTASSGRCKKSPPAQRLGKTHPCYLAVLAVEVPNPSPWGRGVRRAGSLWRPEGGALSLAFSRVNAVFLSASHGLFSLSSLGPICFFPL